MGAATKSAPSVLLLYSYDCTVHERVVIEFAAYLKYECSCDIALDIWEQDAIRTRGAAKWLDEKLDFSDFIIVVGSAGARFKCQRKKQFRMKQSRPVPDMFVYGADQLTEKVRFAKQFGCRAPQCAVICFEYATTSDIPPKLDTLPTLSLMKDIHVLHSQLHGSEENDRNSESNNSKSSLESYASTPTGKQLAEALKDAMQYFHDNPDWLGQCLEPLSPVAPPTVAPSTDAPPLTPPVPPPPSSSSPCRSRSTSQTSAKVLEKRQNKRRQEEDVVLEKVPSAHHLVDRHPNPDLSLNTVVPAPGGSDRGRNSNTPPLPPPISTLGGLVNPAEELEDDLEDEEDEMMQLQKDIDWINNYQWNKDSQTDVLLQLDALSSSFESTSPPYSFSNPLYSQNSSTKHMLQKNGLGRVSVSMNSKKNKPNHNNNSFVVDFNFLDNRGPREIPDDSSTYL